MWRDIAGLRAENNDLKDDLGDAKKALRQSEDSTRRSLERAEAMEEQVNSNGQDELKRLSDELKEREARCDRLHSFQRFCFVFSSLWRAQIGVLFFFQRFFCCNQPRKILRSNWKQMLQSFNIIMSSLRVFVLHSGMRKS